MRPSTLTRWDSRFWNHRADGEVIEDRTVSSWSSSTSWYSAFISAGFAFDIASYPTTAVTFTWSPISTRISSSLTTNRPSCPVPQLEACRPRASTAWMRQTVSMTTIEGAAATQPSPEADTEAEPPFRVLVPVGSARAVQRTSKIAALLAKGHAGAVTYLAVRRLRYDVAGRPTTVPDWLSEAVAEIEEPGVTFEAVARLGQSAVGAIEAAARELEAGALLLHWESDEQTIPHAEHESFTRLFSQPPCTALMLRGRFQHDGPPSILLAAGQSQATQTATEVASALLEAAGGGALQVLQIAPPDASDEELAALVSSADPPLPEVPDGVRSERLVKRARAFQAATMQELANGDADLVVVAAPREGVIHRLSRTRLPERLLQPSPTPVLVVSRPEPRPFTLFHRLWGPIYNRLPSLAEEEKIAVYMQLRRGARADTDYHVLMVLAAAVATLGVLLNSPAVVIGAMLLAPLMTPIAGAALGVVQGDSKLIRLSVGSVISGTSAALLIAFVVAFALPGSEVTGEFSARTEPGLLDLLVALGSGVAAAYAISRPGLSAALPGVAVAAALVPPLAVVATGVALGEWQDAGGGALLFGTNLVAIAAASAATFLAIGFRPDLDRIGRFQVFGRGVLGLTILLAAVAAPLGVLSARALDGDERAARVHEALQLAVADLEGIELAEVTRTDSGADAVNVRARLLAEQPLTLDQSTALRLALESELGDPVNLELEVTQLIRADP